MMIVYPEGTWYHQAKPDDIPEIVDSHLRSGKIVSRLAWNDGQAMKTAATEHREKYRAMVKAREAAGILPDELNEMIRAFMPSRVILTALELDVFSAIASGASADQVAHNIHADPRATEMLLNALVSWKLLDKTNGTFFNTPVSSRFFFQRLA